MNEPTKFYILDPRACGDWGETTLVGETLPLPRSGHFIRIVTYLDYEVEFWRGDDIWGCDGCWVTSPELSWAIISAGLIGAVFADMMVSFSENFVAFSDESQRRYLSGFKRLVPTGMSFYNSQLELLEWNSEDFSIGVRTDFIKKPGEIQEGVIGSPYTLLVSQRAMDLLSDKTRFDIGGCLMETLHMPE